MRVTWITSHKHEKSIVEYGTSPGNYDKSSTTGERMSYRYFFYNSGVIHHITIGPLGPNKTYYYRCGGNGPEFSFKTPPSTFPIEFAIVGELNYNMTNLYILLVRFLLCSCTFSNLDFIC